MALYNVVVTNFLKQYRQSHTSPHNMPIRRNATLPVTLSRTLLHLLLYKACSASTTLHCYAHHSTLDSAAHTDAHITRRTLPQCWTHILPRNYTICLLAKLLQLLPPAAAHTYCRTASLSPSQPRCNHSRVHILPHCHSANHIALPHTRTAALSHPNSTSPTL